MLLAKYMVETQQGSGPMPKISSPQLRLRQQIEGSQRQSLRGSQEVNGIVGTIDCFALFSSQYIVYSDYE